jgi:hypothetical protein
MYDLTNYQQTYKFSRISYAGANDPRCPLGGLELALKRAEKAYKETASPGNFKFKAEDGVGHEATSFMIKESSDWFDKFLKQEDMTT